MHTLTHFARQTGHKNLCFAGGCALNCTANGVVRRSGVFDHMFIQPAAGDDGGLSVCFELGTIRSWCNRWCLVCAAEI